VTGRRCLNIGNLVVKGIEELAAEEAASLVGDLLAHATAERFVYRHVWRPGDLVVWDNRSTLHTITPCDRERFRRTLHRATVKGERPLP
jgi:taurine dioxygenase